jgi:hypothetical protein
LASPHLVVLLRRCDGGIEIKEKKPMTRGAGHGHLWLDLWGSPCSLI